MVPRKAILHTLEASTRPGPASGIVLNRANVEKHAYYYGHYYGTITASPTAAPPPAPQAR